MPWCVRERHPRFCVVKEGCLAHAEDFTSMPEQLRGDHLIDRVPRGTAFKQLGYSDR